MKTTQWISAIFIALFPMVCQAADDVTATTPQDYVTLHNLAYDIKSTTWKDSMQRLSKVGDAFTLEYLKKLEAQKPQPDKAALLKDTLLAIQQRVAKEDRSAVVKLIEIRLERAAWADLRCDPLETTLVPWTIVFLQKSLNTPGVVVELERIQSHYEPSNKEKTPFGATQARVRAFAARILGK